MAIPCRDPRPCDRSSVGGFADRGSSGLSRPRDGSPRGRFPRPAGGGWFQRVGQIQRRGGGSALDRASPGGPRLSSDRISQASARRRRPHPSTGLSLRPRHVGSGLRDLCATRPAASSMRATAPWQTRCLIVPRNGRGSRPWPRERGAPFLGIWLEGPAGTLAHRIARAKVIPRTRRPRSCRAGRAGLRSARVMAHPRGRVAVGALRAEILSLCRPLWVTEKPASVSVRLGPPGTTRLTASRPGPVGEELREGAGGQPRRRAVGAACQD